jgi:hypothetical protein
MTLAFSSTASSGSRIRMDGTTVLDQWEKCCSTFTSDLIVIGEGYHILTYEFRSAANREAVPTDSYASLTYSTGDGTPAFTNLTDERSSAIELDTHPVYADIGWLACMPGSSTINGQLLHADFAQTTPELTTTVDFGNRFVVTPMVFAGLGSTGHFSGHLRLLAASIRQMSLATEYDTCNFVVDAGERLISWIVISAPSETVKSAVSQQPTNASDVAALLRIKELLSLPGYLQWRNGSDPCRDRWAGVECRTLGGMPRVVVLDVRSFSHLSKYLL